MKQHIRTVLPLAEIALCLLTVLGQTQLSGAFSAVIAFPFQPIARGLQLLSLSGTAGNIAAICLYVLLGLCPLALLVRKPRQKEDWLLVLFSALLLFSLYCMVNPGLLSSWTSSPLGSSWEAPFLGTLLWSVLAAWGVLRLIRCFFSAQRTTLLRYLDVLLYLLGLLLIYLIFGSGLSDLLDRLERVRNANQGNGHLLGLTNVFLVLQALADALPYLMDLWALHLLSSMLQTLGREGYSQLAVEQAHALSRFCGRALAAVILTVCGLDLAQLVCLRKLTQIDAAVQIPLLSLLFLLAALLLAQLIGESKRLQDDNDLFI